MNVVVPPTAGVGSRDRTLVSTAARNHQHHIYTCMHVSAASSVPKTIRVPVASLTSNQQHDCMRLAKHRPRSLLPHTKAHPEVGLAAPHNLPQHPFSWNKDQHSISKQTTLWLSQYTTDNRVLVVESALWSFCMCCTALYCACIINTLLRLVSPTCP